MDLPPAASASPPAAFHLPPSSSTSAGRSNTAPTHSVGQLGPSSQSGAVRSSSPVTDSPTPQGPSSATERCAHKDIVRCSSLRGDCCSCADDRAHEQYYERHVDGIGMVLDAPRWAQYCACCREHWDRLNARIPPYRDNQPRITAWDLFHLATPPNVPPSAPNLTLSESTRQSLTPSAQAEILAPEDGFPQSYAIFRLMSPNFSNEYHPVTVEHIRAWAELENRIADEPRFSPEFYTLLAQYHNARYKVKRMTELDRQSRGAGSGIHGGDEYLMLLNNPGPFDVPSTSNLASPGIGGIGRGPGSGGAPFTPPHLQRPGINLSRLAGLGNFSQSTSVSHGSRVVGNRDGDAIPNQPSTGEARTSVASISGASSTTTSPPSLESPSRYGRRRSNSPFEFSPQAYTNQHQRQHQQQASSSATRPSLASDREREQDRDRETGRITAGMSFNAAGATASEGLPSSSPRSPPEMSSHVSYLSHSRSRPHSVNQTVSTFLRSQRSRTLASVTSDIETDSTVADRRRQLRERNESEWESQRPSSATTSSNAVANRNSTGSTMVDAIMSDLPSSQNSDTSSGSGNSSNPETRWGLTEHPAQSFLGYRSYSATTPINEPWSSSQLPGASNRNTSNDSSSLTAGPSRHDIPSNSSNTHPLASVSVVPAAAGPSSGLILHTNGRSLRLIPSEQRASPPGSMPPSESSSSRNGLTSPMNRLSTSASFLPSLAHLPTPRFSPPRNLVRPRPASLSNNNPSSHSRQSSNGSDGFPASQPSRRRERMNPLAHTLGSRADLEREDYDTPLRTMFAEAFEEYPRAEEIRRRGQEMEVERREYLQAQDASTTESNMRRLQEHRSRHYELLHRASLQRQIDQLHAQNRLHGNASNNAAVTNWWPPSNWSANNHHANMDTRSPADNPAHLFGLQNEDEPSSNSEDDYEDLIPLEDDGFFSLAEGYIPRLLGAEDQSSTSHRTPRLSSLPAPPPTISRRSVPDIHTRMERSRRLRERETDLIRSRHSEAIRDIASLVGSVRWNREHGSNNGGPGGRNGNAGPQAPRTLDHPQRPDNMKEEDMKIMADCKVCYGQIADIVLLPCAHLVLCQWCADSVAPAAPGRLEGAVAPRSNCPVCRARVDNKIKVFRC
ncbi:hypothetical protein TWF696_001669 [Orbilia brochopaga]|uniref:RING-type domain-containing protein n=1 Tax=Orbilia brochopaga TaxID=3140254 RepID=A0AAV9U7S2_9PEZI